MSSNVVGLPRVCLFDLGGVAAHFVPERRLPVLAELLGAPPREVTHRIWDSGLSAEFDRGGHTLESMVAALEAIFGGPIDPAELARVWCLAFEPNRDVLALAGEVAAATGVGLFTNNPPALEDGLPVHHPELGAAFSLRLFSCSLGAAKPSGVALEQVEQRTGVAASELALIDDSQANVDAAAARGWTALHFTGASALARELSGLGWVG